MAAAVRERARKASIRSRAITQHMQISLVLDRPFDHNGLNDMELRFLVLAARLLKILFMPSIKLDLRWCFGRKETYEITLAS